MFQLIGCLWNEVVLNAVNVAEDALADVNMLWNGCFDKSESETR